VVSLSVFLHSGWALRHLTETEFGQMWDLPTKWKWLFGGYTDQSNLPFTCTAPAKVLWQYTAQVDKFGIRKGEAEVNPLEWMPSFGIIPSEDLHLDDRFVKAVKNDDDDAPVYIWDNFVAEAVSIPLTPDMEQALNQMQRRLLGCWQSLLYLSFVHYMQAEYGEAWLTNASSDAARDCEVSQDCLSHASLASWWKWKDGLTLFFWGWGWPLSSSEQHMKVFQCLWAETCLTASNGCNGSRMKGPRLTSSANWLSKVEARWYVS